MSLGAFLTQLSVKIMIFVLEVRTSEVFIAMQLLTSIIVFAYVTAAVPVTCLALLSIRFSDDLVR